MSDQDRSTFELQCKKLRAELKQWENDWAKTSGGKKPSREDIKQNREISNKYKEYNKLRDTLAGKIEPTKTLLSAAGQKEPTYKQQERKRKQEGNLAPPPSQTPQKRAKHAQTPLKSQTYADVELTAAVTPSLSRKLFSSPAFPTSIDPTPQRDGRVLGLWDLLSATPSRPSGDDVSSNKIIQQINSTPSKRNGIVDNDSTIATPSASHPNRTPNSSRSNKFLLDELPGMMTPLHKRERNQQPKDKTPSSRSVSKLHFSTPAFLRRSTAPLPAVDENGEWKVEPIKLPRKPLARGLSNMVASLRKLEEEALDDELEAMREMEMEMEAGGSTFAPRSKPTANVAAATVSDEAGPRERTDDMTVHQEESIPEAKGEEQQQQQKQHPERPVLLGGFDDEGLYDSQEEDQLDRGQPLRVYKKKGQKRTTRKVNIKPSRVKRSSVSNGGVEASDSGGDYDDEEVVPETQFDSTKFGQEEENGDDALLDQGPGSEPDGDFGHDSCGDDSYNEETRNKRAKRERATLMKTSKQERMRDKEKKATKKLAVEDKENEGVVKKAIRKVKATAHANFKRLKLRNSGAKGGPGYNSKFRRRR